LFFKKYKIIFAGNIVVKNTISCEETDRKDRNLSVCLGLAKVRIFLLIVKHKQIKNY